MYDSETFILNLPFPPSVNSYYGITLKGKFPIKYIKDAGKKYQNEVNIYVQENNFNIGINIPIKVEIILNFPTRHRSDLDNRMKALLDSLTLSNVWEDDSLIDELHIIRGTIAKPGSVIIKISEYKE